MMIDKKVNIKSNISHKVLFDKKYDIDDYQKNLYKHFPSDGFLGDEHNVINFMLWVTFFRRNLDAFVIDYFKINLHTYQKYWIYEMGISQFFTCIASRASAKSWMLALFACCKCVLYPNSIVILASSTLKQTKLLIQDKIEKDLMGRSPALRTEIKKVVVNQQEMAVYFHNHSVIKAVCANENALGNRSTALAREEAFRIKKYADDRILSPFQILRQPMYLGKEYYANIEVLKEEPVNIYITSSWFDNNGEESWLWKIVDTTYVDMLNGKPSCVLAFDESVALKHNIKSQKYFQAEKKKQDPITWRIEFMNERLKESQSAFFSHKILHQNQISKQVFYPQDNIDFRNNKKNSYAIPKQKGEVRLIGCDMAFVERKGNDNSIFVCMRLLPETKRYERADSESLEISTGYRRVVPYIESIQGGDTAKQARRIRQLYEDFNADYIVLDIRNAGISIYDNLARVMYDEERNVEYSPLSCMNDDTIAKRIKSEGAMPCIYAISASQKLNSDIALDFRRILEQRMIDFLVPYEIAMEEILTLNKDYLNAIEANTQLFYERPFLETQALINECAELTYEKKELTGAIVVKEPSTGHKDRFSACSYTSYMATLLERDLFNVAEDYEFSVFIN